MTVHELRGILARDADGQSLGADADRRKLIGLVRQLAKVIERQAGELQKTSFSLDKDLYERIWEVHGQVPHSTVSDTIEEAIKLALEFKEEELLAALRARTKVR